MIAIPANRQTIVTTSLLALILISVSGFSGIREWIQVILISIAYLYCWSVTAQGIHHSRWRMAFQVTTALAIVLAWFALNRIIALYCCGVLFLGLFIVRRIIDSGGRRISARDIAIPVVVVTAALLVSEITISRIAIDLSSLPVPSKFQLHSDEKADRKHHASRGYPMHDLNPVKVELGADHLSLNEPMPWLEFQARRDTIFPILSVQYRFFNIVVHELRGADLHKLRLAERSDDVTLDKTADGISINNIGADESAWLKLPGLHNLEPGFATVSKVRLFRVLLWLLACLAFLGWQPAMVRAEPAGVEQLQ